MRPFFSLSIVLALLAVPPLAQAGKVTTNDYSADRTAADIDASCKDLDIDSKGKLTGTCNPRKASTLLTLQSYAECHGGTLRWGSGGFIDNLSGADIAVSSDGKRYLLTGTCTHPTDATDTAVDSLQLDGRVGNSRGHFSYPGG